MAALDIVSWLSTGKEGGMFTTIQNVQWAGVVRVQ
jgi:hypothetical protein